jgi:hypothetical protein
MGLRTHRPIGKWPHTPKAVVRRRLGLALELTMVAIPLVAVGFAYWASSPPPWGNGGTMAEHALEALKTAAILAACAWAVSLTLFGIVRWIMTGEAPSA